MAGALQRAGRAIAIAAIATSSACLRPQVFNCDADAACMIDDRQGRCLGGFCAYPDVDCDSALRFGPAAGDGMAGECVPIGDTDPTVATSSESSSGESCGPCDAPPDPCHLPAGACEAGACIYPPAPSGTSCAGDDPCIIAAQCDALGECIVMERTICDDPPSPCHTASGSCIAPGRCEYVLRAPGEECQDGDDCTLHDKCDSAGICVPGEICPTENPCAVGSCGETGVCSFFPVIDGTQCGDEAVVVCCSGACVNLETDENNCGGCGVECMGTDVCSTLEPTPMCMPS